MKETITKRFFAPIWKCDEIEYRLEQLENDGWRLDKISGFRKFKFVKSQPKTTKYFFTCSFVRERGMILTEQTLKSQHKATEISGNFIELLKSTSIYRITKEADLCQRKFYRHIHLRHLVLQYILIGLLFAAISGAGIALSCILNKNPLFNTRHIFLFIVCLFGLFITIRYLFGLLHLRKQYIKFFHSNKNCASKE